MTVASAPHLRRTGSVLTLVSLAAIAFATLTPEAGVAAESHFCLVCGSLGGVDVVLNVLLFVPLGIGLALVGFSGKSATLTVFALSVLIETLQLTVVQGRSSTIGDVLTNTLGGALGFAACRYRARWLRPTPRLAWSLSAAWAIIWIGIQTISSYGLSPSLPDSAYYGELARELGGFAVFRGKVLRASVGSSPIPDGAVPDSHRVRQLLLNGASVKSTAVPDEFTSDVAPIVRVADGGRDEILILAQSGRLLVFGMRTGAATLRLRSPLFGLPNAFVQASPENAPIPQVVSGQYAKRFVRLTASNGSMRQDRIISLSPSLVWTFWYPGVWTIEGSVTEHAVSWISFFCVAFPLGYWSVRITAWPRSAAATLRESLLVGTGLVCLGLIFIPTMFGLPIAPFRDWSASIIGILAGHALRQHVSAKTPAKG